MKHLGFGHILLLIGVGLLIGSAAEELTAFQNLVPSADVGQMVTVTVSLIYNGQTPTQAVVTPSLPYGVVANAGGQSTQLYPGVTKQVSYPLMAQQSGTYWIVSEISYAEDGTWRNLRLEAPFTATDRAVPEPQPQPQPMPGDQVPGVVPDGSNPTGTDPSVTPPGSVSPGGMSPPGREPGNDGTGDRVFPGDKHDHGEQPKE